MPGVKTKQGYAFRRMDEVSAEPDSGFHSPLAVVVAGSQGFDTVNRNKPAVGAAPGQQQSNSNTSGLTATTSTPTPTPSSPSAATTPTKDKLKKLIPKLRQPVQHENIYTVPNILTFTRLLAAPAVGYFILHAQPVWALSLFFYAGVTDMVDGYLARKYNAQTVVGTVIDPMADKALMTIAVVTLTMNGTFPLWLSVIILGRDVALAISAIYFRWISLPPPKTMARYWDFSLPSAEVHPTEISKINTFLQLLLVGNAMLLPVLPEALVNAYNLTGIFEGWQYLVAGTTVWSGLSYVSNKDAVKILTTEEIDARVEKRDAERNEAKVEAEADAMFKKP
ncbi:hypothetical protein HRR83_004193 [Exophiala dermatitidis]|nr:hypothetical protein HRR73_006345 [Exophiala dermatitidis]KAJ4517828.1 hypothetical protein HRR75_003047 [Exophiala dermatitidis]KAJ4521502.1 hypothetical protein HRR74_003326 [Exophiala dermatitidis]KAJ4542176.1 hypothetical protein HRR77_006061 [Exophiala dermatitidis]KAJ4544942.1 hypothetical protein HRR76_002978 [Exophiala dermatitidis]